jgi:cbb3-type cytochrome oxidase subunit 3
VYALPENMVTWSQMRGAEMTDILTTILILAFLAFLAFMFWLDSRKEQP